MLKKEDIEHLAALARIKISEEEKEEFAGKLDAVLLYVSEISKVTTEEGGLASEVLVTAEDLRNVVRADEGPYPGGEYTEAILANAPNTEDGYVKVQQIL